jgi:AraC-like DNA-binding protein
MVFIGENLPHVWLNDETYYNGQQNHKAKAIVVYFNKNLFGSNFYELDETSNIKALFEKAKRGIKIGDETRKKIGAKLEKMLAQKDFERVIGLFEVLHLISTAKDNELITTEGYTKPVSKDGADRLASVYKFVHENFKQPISLNQVAELANLTPQSFCRLFKKRNKKKFVEYLNDMRIAQACKYLIETDWSISEVAYACGYKSVSNFNKLFKETKNCCPKAFRVQFDK